VEGLKRHMNPSQSDLSVEGQREPSWEVAEQLAAHYLPQSYASAEANILTRGGRRVLQAVIYELGLSPDHPDLVSACYSFLEEEQVSPGSVISRLLSSKSPKVVSLIREIHAHGEGWVLTETPPKNLFVLTALINLPNPASGRS
jgi:hypothetical protein